MQSSLKINQLYLDVHIGTTKLERSHSQKIAFDIEISYSKVPRGCISDKIEETLCYADLIELIKKLCSGKEFNLIEHLGYSLFKEIKIFLKKEDKLKLSIIKVPPLNEKLSNCCFIIED